MKNALKSEMHVGWVFQLVITWHHATKHRLKLMFWGKRTRALIFYGSVK